MATLNISIPSVNDIAINNNCIDWCKEQHYANNYKYIILLFISLVGMFLFKVVYNHSDIIVQRTDLTEEQVQKGMMFLYDTATWFLVIWFITFMFF